MNRNKFGHALIAGTFAALGAGIVIPVTRAGPGPGYWVNRVEAEKKPAAIPAPAPTTPRACTDARLVAVTETRPTWHNGRGPLVTVEVGKRVECTSCDTPVIVMKPSGHNGRGAMAPVEIRGKHDCAKSGCDLPGASLK